MTKNLLAKYFLNNKGKMIHKWLHYFDIYDKGIIKNRAIKEQESH